MDGLTINMQYFKVVNFKKESKLTVVYFNLQQNMA